MKVTEDVLENARITAVIHEEGCWLGDLAREILRSQEADPDQVLIVEAVAETAMYFFGHCI